MFFFKKMVLQKHNVKKRILSIDKNMLEKKYVIVWTYIKNKVTDLNEFYIVYSILKDENLNFKKHFVEKHKRRIKSFRKFIFPNSKRCL